jgi:hypothetical protein
LQRLAEVEKAWQRQQQAIQSLQIPNTLLGSNSQVKTIKSISSLSPTAKIKNIPTKIHFSQC